MSIWGWGSPACYCQPAAAGGFIDYRSQEWALHSPSPTGFVYLAFSLAHAPFVFSSIQSYSPVAIAVFFYLEFTWGGTPLPVSSGAPHFSHCWKPSPLKAHCGGCTTPAFSGQLVYLQFMWGSTPLPLSGGAFHMTTTVTSLPLSKHTAGGGATPTFSSWLVYLEFVWGSAPPPLSRAQDALPSLLRVLFFSAACLLFSLVFSLFSLGGGQSVQGSMQIWPRVFCGSTMCCLAHLVVYFSQAS
jgi:hypothetical protein